MAHPFETKELAASGADARSDRLVWIKNPPAPEWDAALAGLFGHPLQSSVWGRARAIVDGIVEHRWLLRQNGRPVWMIRLEERRIAGHIKVGWAPRGPTGETTERSCSLPPGFADLLRAEGFALLIADPWVAVRGEATNSPDDAGHPRPQTIWLDLSKGADAIFEDFHPQMRKGVRRAARGGVAVRNTSDPLEISQFVGLCATISSRKGFELRVTSKMIQTLLELSADSENVRAAQLISVKNGDLGSGLFVMSVGRAMHQIWGGTNRNLRQERVGEACQWASIEWAVAGGCVRYDLEGIDPRNNPAVYEFKKRIGGEEITLCGHRHIPLNALGWLVNAGHQTLTRLRG